MTRQIDFETRFVDIIGGDVTLSVRQFLGMMRHRLGLGFLALVGTALFASDPTGLLNQLPLWATALVWLFAVPVFLLFYIAGLTSATALQQQFLARWRMPLPLVGLMALLPTVTIVEYTLYAATGGAFDIDIPSRAALLYLTVLVFEVLFFRFVRPLIDVRGNTSPDTAPAASATDAEAAEPTPPDAPQTRHILIGAQKIPLDKLRHIEAREHHVHVTLDGESLTHRARLSDIVAQTRPEDGCQPHRSWWVARRVAKALKRDGQRHLLYLNDDTRIPVARTRVDEVRNWIDSHLDGPG